MRWTRLLGGLATTSLLLVASVSMAAPASAAPTPPAAYVAVGRAYPLFWDNYSGISVNEELRVPYVSGLTNHAPLSRAEAALALPDLRTKTMTGDAIQGLACTGYEAKRCRDPFLPEAFVSHSTPDPVAAQQYASFLGREGQNPGHVDAVNTCEGECGKQLIRTSSEAAAPAGAIQGLISVGSSSARQDVTVDDGGRLVGVAVSELRHVAIGSEQEVTFSRLTSTARATGTGAENAKDGQGTVSVSDLVILGNPVELTRAGLKLSQGAMSEQEAYDGAKALLEKLRTERGIGLHFGDVVGEVVKEADQVTIQVRALTVTYDTRVHGVTAERGIEQVIDLASSTMILMAFDEERRIDVVYEGDDVVVQAEPEPAPNAEQGPAPAEGPSASLPPPSSSTSGPAKATPGGTAAKSLPSNGKVKMAKPAKPSTTPATPVTPPPAPVPAPNGSEVTDPVVPPPSSETSVTPPGEPGVDETAIGLRDLTDGLRGARSVTRAFGAFVALGLLLPVARFLIKRFG